MSKRSRSSRSARPATPTQASSATPTQATPATPTQASSAGVAQPAGGRSRPGAPTTAVRRTRAGAAATPRSPVERYRGLIIGIAILAIVIVGGAYLFVGAAQPAYACTSELARETPAVPAPGATPRLGQVTRDLGRAHVDTGTRVTYEFCPPTSGPHYNDARFGPIATRFYGADDQTDPEGWVHNLEHGMMTVLYRCPEGCDEAAQAALRALQGQLSASPLCAFPATASVVVTRFDDMATPYAAVVWGRVYLLDTLDVAAITAFQQQSADRGPEPQCQNAVPGASPSAAPGASPSAAPGASPSAVPGASPSAAPSATPAP